MLLHPIFLGMNVAIRQRPQEAVILAFARFGYWNHCISSPSLVSLAVMATLEARSRKKLIMKSGRKLLIPLVKMEN